ncbi:MAG: hypothetical protein QW290_02945 [Sulfolobales archaeon]
MSLGGDAQSRQNSILDRCPVPLGSTTTHEPAWTPKSTWVRWKSLDATTNENKVIKMNT